MTNLLTFQFLRQLQKQEKQSKTLNMLDENFYADIFSYLKTRTQQENISNTEKTHTEVIIKDLINTRETKIVNSALINTRTGLECENLLPKEKELYNNAIEIMKKYRKNIEKEGGIEKTQPPTEKDKDDSDTEDKPKPEDNEENRIKLKITDNIPKFMAEDSKSYGPYSKDDEADIPKKAADILIKMKKAETIE